MGTIVTNKLYRKDFNQYSEEDWKYIFSIYKLRDKYNFTQEEFLAAELVDKVMMMMKMDESLYKGGSFTIDEDKKPLVDSCSENSCEAINDFLDNEEVKDNPTTVIDTGIKQFLDSEVDDLEIIKNQFDLAFKDRKRLLTIREFVVQQLKDIDADLEVVKNTIEEFNQIYLEYKKTK